MKNITIPNALTLGRILLTPVLVLFLLDGNLTEALVVFFIAGVTDGLDGFIARVFHQKSELGAYLDPLADKLLLVSSLILLGHLRLAPNWLVVIAVSRDVMIVLGLVTLRFHNVPIEIDPTLTSKCTTLLQLFTIFIILGSSLHRLPEWCYTAVYVTTAGLCLLSGAQYITRGLVLLEAHRTNNGNNGHDAANAADAMGKTGKGKGRD